MSNDNKIVAMNMTNFFNRELMMYAFGDIKLKQPLSLKMVGFTLAFLVVWTLPLFLIFGIPTQPFQLVLYLAPPIGLGQVAVRPIFGGKTLVDYVKTAILYLGEPKGWADGKPFNVSPKVQTYGMDSEIWISRRRELALLADILEGKDVELVKEKEF